MSIACQVVCSTIGMLLNLVGNLILVLGTCLYNRVRCVALRPESGWFSVAVEAVT